MSECKNEHSDLFRVVNVGLLYSSSSGYHEFPYAAPYMLPDLYGKFESFLLVTVLNTLSKALLNVLQYLLMK